MKARKEREHNKLLKYLDTLALILFILAVFSFLLAVLLPVPDAQAREIEPEEPQIVKTAYDPAWDIPAKEEAECTDTYLGEYTLTAYCACPICCGVWSNGYTATGTPATEGRTIAVDPSVIPYGAKVLLIWPDGTQHEYIAEDCGGSITGSRIDIFIADHEAARVFGVQHAAAYLVEEAP